MKKKIIAILTAISSMQAVAFAEITAKTDNRNGVVSVEGTTTPETIVTLTVKSADDNSGLYQIKQTVSDEKGNYSFNFKLRKRQTVQDEYKYILSVKGDGEYSEDLIVFSENAIENFAAEVKNKNLKQFLDDESKYELVKSFGLDIDSYKGLADGDAIVKAFYEDAGTDDLSNDNIADIFNMEIILALSKEADNEEYLALLGKDLDKREATDFTKKRLYETKDYSSIKEYENQILMFETLDKVNNAKYSQLEDLFEEYEKVLTLDKCGKYDDYKDLSSSNRRKANETIVSKLLKNPAETTKKFIDVFESAVKDADKGSKPVGGGGGGGGGSHAGGKGSTTSGLSYTVPDVSDIVVPEKKKVFKDVELDFWAEDNIRTLVDADIINGYEDGSFKPDNSITREEFVTILVKAFKLKKNNAVCSFEDAGKDKWFYTYVASAFEAGVVNGVSETMFGAGENITRQDVAVMIARAMKLTAVQAGEAFADDGDIAGYAKEAVYSLKKSGIIGGRGENVFAPSDNCTRAECVTMIRKAMDVK